MPDSLHRSCNFLDAIVSQIVFRFRRQLSHIPSLRACELVRCGSGGSVSGLCFQILEIAIAYTELASLLLLQITCQESFAATIFKKCLKTRKCNKYLQIQHVFTPLFSSPSKNHDKYDMANLVHQQIWQILYCRMFERNTICFLHRQNIGPILLGQKPVVLSSLQ